MRGSVFHCGPCPYLPDREFQVFVPEEELQQHYRALMDHNFRRNGDILYHTWCDGCSACEATRVDVARFRMRRDQRRCWKRNSDLLIAETAVVDDDEHRELFSRYESAVHDNQEVHYQQLSEFGMQDCRALEARDHNGELLAVTLIDVFADAVSSVYCYYEPSTRKRALGTFMVLQELEYCRRHNKDWLYLGFHVAACQKLAYKARFRPLQILRDQDWQWYDPAQDADVHSNRT